MPVYLDDKDDRTEFIKKEIFGNPMIAIDSSHFATWVFTGDMGYVSETFDAYSNLIETVATEFPNEEYSDLVQEIQLVINKGEKEYFDAWSEYGKKLAKETTNKLFKEALILSLDDSDYKVSYNNDSSLPDC